MVTLLDMFRVLAYQMCIELKKSTHKMKCKGANEEREKGKREIGKLIDKYRQDEKMKLIDSTVSLPHFKMMMETAEEKER